LLGAGGNDLNPDKGEVGGSSRSSQCLCRLSQIEQHGEAHTERFFPNFFRTCRDGDGDQIGRNLNCAELGDEAISHDSATLTAEISTPSAVL
jgi:hypothetical protein